VTGAGTVPLDGLSYDIFAQASMAVRRYQALVARARAERRLTATAADLLTQDADNIIRGLQAM
jgi:hypothetical protein